MAPIQYFWRHPLAEQVREEGREQGRVQAGAEMVVRILEWRGIHPVPDSVLACTDQDQQTAWAKHAVHATDAAELFVEE
ncbi:hypothetical protein GCM10022403_074570 [Streptomyces coacervatus]|uniref:Uncharacterized protein n=1 Tax=Streptomyces coacervatus TaxID=647381 RepID=A0ABP7IYT5_9ACTN|nr:hypothetical protein [Streptomyces coacervatus]MDF2270108.1 hypothetical protein [Streptomyces coacervatus]